MLFPKFVNYSLVESSSEVHRRRSGCARTQDGMFQHFAGLTFIGRTDSSVNEVTAGSESVNYEIKNVWRPSPS